MIGVLPDLSGALFDMQTLCISETKLLAFACFAVYFSFKTTYNFPDAITKGTSLTNLNATLGGGIIGETADRESIRQSEFFTGKAELTLTGGGLTGTVDLYRRVAGVMGWFTHLPQTATAVQIVLYQKQHKSVPLLPLEQSPLFKDFVDDKVTEETGNVLVEIPIDWENPSGMRVYAKGSYVLPVPAPAAVDADDYTLKVVVIGADNTILRSRRVKLIGDDALDSTTGSGTGIIDTEGAYRFPIMANHFYGIGTEENPISLGGHERNIMITLSPDWVGIAPSIPLE